MKTCTIDGCDRRFQARGLCGKHYHQARVDGTIPAPRCKVDGCDTAVRSRGMCHAHYERWRSEQGIERDTCEECDAPSMGRGRWCYAHWRRLRVDAGGRGEPIRCGTQRGRDRHGRRGEPPCTACEYAGYDWMDLLVRSAA